MRNHNRTAKSFTLERDVSEYVTRTKGENSASERVNQILKRAMHQERYERLEREAEGFFASVKDTDRRQIRAFQSAAIRSITRE